LSTIDQNHIRNWIIGKYYFDNNQHAIGDFFALLKIQDGQLVAVE
jgi:hypothetical protein